jgi:hypothetical protein
MDHLPGDRHLQKMNFDEAFIRGSGQRSSKRPRFETFRKLAGPGVGAVAALVD